MTELFKRRDLEQYSDSLAAYMPGGELFASKSIKNSNFRKLIRGLSGELFRANGLLREYSNEVLPDETSKFLSEWESALGIPDTCFSGTGSNDVRRRDILVKLASLGVQTEQDFIDLAALFGVVVSIKHEGLEERHFSFTFPILFTPNEIENRFTIIFEFTVNEDKRFTLSFPITFGGGEIAILECLFSKLKPANCNIVFLQV